MLYIIDESIKAAFVRMMRKLYACQEQVLRPFLNALRGINNREILQQILELEDRIEKNSEQQNVLVNLMSAGYVEPDIFHAEKNELIREVAELETMRKGLSMSINGDLIHAEEATKLLRFFIRATEITEYSDEIFLEYVDNITVLSRESIVFNMKCGLKLKERLV